ncbi:hypothetical protein HPP92_019805 [Vanilla planifolia]|uniref:Uncharacterized protein n=1 Tax=Vanilla planifolia TaxID=51239 RepID=A0A835ULG8_VANPL|nr:hypothetical protein HPP92_019805 [Vanilla planifolia]
MALNIKGRSKVVGLPAICSISSSVFVKRFSPADKREIEVVDVATARLIPSGQPPGRQEEEAAKATPAQVGAASFSYDSLVFFRSLSSHRSFKSFFLFLGTFFFFFQGILLFLYLTIHCFVVRVDVWLKLHLA